MREAEREKARASLADKQRLDIEYLKNTVLKLYETGTVFPSHKCKIHLQKGIWEISFYTFALV